VAAPCSQWIACSAASSGRCAKPLKAGVRRRHMPGLAVAVNGTRLAAVSTEGSNVIGVRVHGDVLGPEFAVVEVSGGLYGEGDPKHLIWLSEHPISPGNEIEVSLLESVETSPPGKTIEELFAGEPEPMGPWQPLDQVLADISREPRVRERFSFRVEGPDSSVSSTTSPGDHSFGFSVTWNWLHPERVRVSLSSNTLDGIAKRAGGTDHAEFFLHYGERVRLRVDV
jgi:hypothetical protein